MCVHVCVRVWKCVHRSVNEGSLPDLSSYELRVDMLCRRAIASTDGYKGRHDTTGH